MELTKLSGLVELMIMLGIFVYFFTIFLFSVLSKTFIQKMTFKYSSSITITLLLL